MIAIAAIDVNGMMMPETPQTLTFGSYFDGVNFNYFESQQEADEYAASVNTQPSAVEIEFQKYLKRKSDGEEYHLRICAELRVAKLGGGINQAQYDAIYAATAPTRNEIISGQWLSGLIEFEKVQGLLSANLYNRIHNDITTYISANY